MSPSADQAITAKGYKIESAGANNMSKGGANPHVPPTFGDKYEQRRWMLEHASAAFRVFARFGYSEGEAGHISLRDPVDPTTFFINPLGVHFAMISPADLVHVDRKGNILPDGNQAPINAAGFAIHLSLQEARPDINAACHAHSVYGKAYSAFGQPIEMLNQDACVFYNTQAVYKNFGGVAIEGDEGQEIADAAGGARAVILQNHGLLTMGKTVDEAAYLFMLMEKSCQVQLLADAAAAGAKRAKVLIPEDVCAYSADVTNHPDVMYSSFQSEYSYQRRLDKDEFLCAKSD
ncbi:arad-like aldolase/epimerase [Metschnikowia bicuspidata var. bicuspidata NRRL YB-4993]|uniref:Arad-like aldolase/epimerase n=1 Tax=Metschnikowia bicuspidata var. bicuspidata NRRL YB-4993 TaxID=869754 RepID=A0A1A0HEY0_9ASCO|nr:arad-like aldolase/epimerase [Metschnikowia bicuspidata var. bicuspidata NRRL YB-4993]OBA22447.1 arad-like aldolase/epimerase [Metschnikowia bicuspidata var. bicuspidata NRRL YB-4993]